MTKILHSRSRATTLASLTVLAFAAACSSDQTSTSPDVATARRLTTPTFIACSAEGATAVQGSIDALLDGGTQNAAFSQFAKVTRTCTPSDAATRRNAFKLLEFVAIRLRQKQVVDPTGNVNARYVQLLLNIFQFIGSSLAELPTATEFELAEADNDGAIGVAFAGQPFQLVANTGNAAVKTGADFFVQDDVVILRRRFDLDGVFVFDEVSETFYRALAPRYAIEVYPRSAQANAVPTEAEVSSMPTAAYATCIDHPEGQPPANPRVLYSRFGLGEGGQVLPLSFQAVGLLNCNEIGYTSPGLEIGAAKQSRSFFYAYTGPVSRAASWMGARLGDLLLPKNLYAWDGGVGGSTFTLDGEFAPGEPFVGEL